MGYVLGQCPQCNNVMSMPDDSAIVRCPTCSSEVSAMEAATLAGTASQMQQPAAAGARQDPYGQAQGQAGYQPAQPDSPYGQAMQHQPFAPQPPYGAGGQAPNQFLASWQTNIPLTVMGIVAIGAFGGWFGAQENPGTLAVLLGLAYSIYAIVHAAWIYPSCFKEKPVIASNEAMSFLNAVAGGIIFGLLWNHNLTRGQKGVAHIVYLVLLAVGVVLSVLATTLYVGAMAVGA